MRDVKAITREYLKANGYDGLCSDLCGCDIEDLMPCAGSGGEQAYCEAGYKVPCCPVECGEGCDFHIVTKKPQKKEAD